MRNANANGFAGDIAWVASTEAGLLRRDGRGGSRGICSGARSGLSNGEGAKGQNDERLHF
jgi:hypothetical protein